MALGLTAALIGQDPLTGAARLTFGTVTLNAGVDFISVIVGLFAISEVMINVEQRITAISEMNISNWMPTWADIKQCRWTMIRATGVGFFLGLLPDAPRRSRRLWPTMLERVSKHPSGSARGRSRSRRPGSGEQRHLHRRVRAAFLVRASHGAVDGGAARGADDVRPQPGPMLFATNPDFVWAVIASMYIGNVMLLILNLPLVGMWAKIVRIPFYILGPMIVFCAVIGTYSIRFQAFDVWVMLLFGVIGYFMRKLAPRRPDGLASVLAQMLETALGQSLLISQGSPLIFFTRPISAVFMALALLSIGRGIWSQVKAKAPEVVTDDADY